MNPQITVTQPFAFEPSAARARRLDHDMHVALGDSLAYLAGEIRGRIYHDAEALGALAARLRAGERHGPAAFALYYDLAPALMEGRARDAEATLVALSTLRPVGDGLDLRSIGDPALAGLAASYRAKLDTDPDTRFSFRDPPAELVAPFGARVLDGLALLERELPELAGEIRGLLSQIMLAVGGENEAYVFDGGSSYMLWGLLTLNARFHETRVRMAEALAHESAHVLLFGFAIDEPLTLNNEDERYPSPLRVDLRPMDGIYHATFVSARMHFVMARLAASGALTADERREAFESAEADAVNFAAGYATVAAHGVLSAAGAGLMASAKAYMDAAAPAHDLG